MSGALVTRQSVLSSSQVCDVLSSRSISYKRDKSLCDVSNGIKRVLFGVDLRSIPVGTLACPHGLRRILW